MIRTSYFTLILILINAGEVWNTIYTIYEECIKAIKVVRDVVLLSIWP
jgi:hypothetical protein